MGISICVVLFILHLLLIFFLVIYGIRIILPPRLLFADELKWKLKMELIFADEGSVSIEA